MPFSATMKKRLWSPDEDEKLQKYVSQHGFGNWSEVAKKAGLQRCGKSCRLRWINYLRPHLKRGKFSTEEKLLIVNLQKVFGNSWSKIAAHLPGRTDSDIKNFWHSHFRKKRPPQLMANHSFDLHGLIPAINSAFYPSQSSHAPLLKPSSSSSQSFEQSLYPYQHSLFYPSVESVSGKSAMPTHKAHSSAPRILSCSSSHLPHPSMHLSSGCSMNAINVENNGLQKQHWNGYVQHADQKVRSSILSSPMLEEDSSFYEPKNQGIKKPKELIKNDFDLDGALCNQVVPWSYEKAPIDTDTTNGMVATDSYTDATNSNVNVEMLMHQMMPTSSSCVPICPPSEGLDLIVLSCVNWTQQLEHKDLFPSASPHQITDTA